jgi:hypothetical protein
MMVKNIEKVKRILIRLKKMKKMQPVKQAQRNSTTAVTYKKL